MAQNTIAIVCDCDDTLAPDTTVQLLSKFGVDATEFFGAVVEPLVKEGWDPVLAYLHKMIELAEPGGPLEGLNSKRIREIGPSLGFYPGVPECFTLLKDEIESSPRYRDVGIRVESYVISSGIGDLIRASVLAKHMHQIWACDFAYREDGRLLAPKKVISFTDKTRYLFLIQKGRTASEYFNQPFVANEPMDESERPVPFRNMIYIGDSAGDIPCMSLVDRLGGTSIGILSKRNPAKTWALAYGRRARITVPPEFEADGYAYQQLREALLSRAEQIRTESMAGQRRRN